MTDVNVLAVRGSGKRIAPAYSAELPALIAAAIAAFVLTDVRIGGASSPFAASLSALSPLHAAAAVLGTVLSALAAGDLMGNIGEIFTCIIMCVYGCIFGRRQRIGINCLTAAAVYFICSCAVSVGDKPDWVIFAAIFVRSVMCCVMAMCFHETADALKNGFAAKKSGSFRICSLSAVYIIIISALCSAEIGIINMGRTAAGIVCAAAARKFGIRGGAVMGVMSAAAFLLCDPVLARCGAMTAFAAMIAGMYMDRGKYAVNTAFICSCFGITAAAGMPSGTPQFIADMGAAAIIYCLLPERLYVPRLNALCPRDSCKPAYSTDRLSFAANILEDVGRDVENASEMLRSVELRRQKDELYSAVKSHVCSGVCTKYGCTALCGSSTAEFREGCFKAAQTITEKEGAISEGQLPAGFDGCKKRAELARRYNHEYRLRQMQIDKDACSGRFLENISEQLSACCGMITSLAADDSGSFAENPVLSESARRIMTGQGIDARSVCVSFNTDNTPFCEAYIYADANFSEASLSDVTDKLSALLGAELEKPAMVKSGSGEKIMHRVRWRGASAYYPDHCVLSIAAENNICGDSHCAFEDGRGYFYLILADGMGKGGRAAAQSSMAVSLLKRLILSGMSRTDAIKALNVMMNAASPDEIFTTIDLLTVDCMSGRAYLIKMGAAPTLVCEKSGENFGCRRYEDASAPVGIISETHIEELTFELTQHSRTVMVTDGICCDEEYISSVLENEKLTCRQIAERIIACSCRRETETDENYRRRDDKTAAAIRLYKSPVN